MESQHHAGNFSECEMGTCAGSGNVYECLYGQDNAGLCEFVHRSEGAAALRGNSPPDHEGAAGIYRFSDRIFSGDGKAGKDSAF